MEEQGDDRQRAVGNGEDAFGLEKEKHGYDLLGICIAGSALKGIRYEELCSGIE